MKSDEKVEKLSSEVETFASSMLGLKSMVQGLQSTMEERRKIKMNLELQFWKLKSNMSKGPQEMPLIKTRDNPREEENFQVISLRSKIKLGLEVDKLRENIVWDFQ